MFYFKSRNLCSKNLYAKKMDLKKYILCLLLAFEKPSKNSMQIVSRKETRLFPVDLTLDSTGNGTEIKFLKKLFVWNHICVHRTFQRN
jgi:hypothetical protein